MGAEFGAGINGMVQQFFRQLPVPFRHEEVGVSPAAIKVECRRKENAFGRGGAELGSSGCGLGIQGLTTVGAAEGSSDELGDEDGFDSDVRATGRFKKPKVSFFVFCFPFFLFIHFLLKV